MLICSQFCSSRQNYNVIYFTWIFNSKISWTLKLLIVRKQYYMHILQCFILINQLSVLWSMKLVLHGHMFFALCNIHCTAMLQIWRRQNFSRNRKKLRMSTCNFYYFSSFNFLGGNVTRLPACPLPFAFEQPPSKKVNFKGFISTRSKIFRFLRNQFLRWIETLFRCWKFVGMLKLQLSEHSRWEIFSSISLKFLINKFTFLFLSL